MATSPKEGRSSDPLESVLRDVEAELRARLHEACEAEAKGLASETSEEIRRLEDSLLAAAVAAEQTIRLRRHMDRRGREAEQTSLEEEERDAAAPNEPALLHVREFHDENGQSWRAWPVTPGQSRERRGTDRYLGEFHKGWICFEAVDGTARRRLPQQPAHWADLQESELAQLLEQAIRAPERKHTASDKKASDTNDVWPSASS